MVAQTIVVGASKVLSHSSLPRRCKQNVVIVLYKNKLSKVVASVVVYFTGSILLMAVLARRACLMLFKRACFVFCLRCKLRMRL